MDGLSNTDTISDEARLAEARARMEGGFHRLVVLHRGRHRKPIGLLHSEQLLAMTKPVAG
jgi:CBS domain containing-hemolysin-like protein